MSHLAEILAGSVVNKLGEKIEDLESHFNGKIALIYFSAHWCPPCRNFTPKLAEFYTSHREALNFEVVFVSGDSSEEAFNEYYGSMPWLAVDFNEEDLKTKLNDKFEVNGIPTLVVLDASTGDVLNSDAVESVFEDAEGQNFPWKS